jgi:hypothetical protein
MMKEIPRTVFWFALIMFMSFGTFGGLMLDRPVLMPMLANVKPDARTFMQMFVSGLVMSATLFVILSNRYQAKDKHWAYTTLGLVIGFWLKA